MGEGTPPPLVLGMVVGVAVVLGVGVYPATCTTTEPTPEIKTEAPPPRPDALIRHKDCPLYEFGEFRGFKRHGETWRNDGSDCEICECTDGQKRCYYHYCNAGMIEGYMTPPSAQGDKTHHADQPPPPPRPPLDDEDLTEGSGFQLWPDDYYKVVEEAFNKPNIGDSGSSRSEVEDKDPRDNETHDDLSPDFCDLPCKKTCPHGYKVDKVTGCRKCKCLKCHWQRKCLLKCSHGYAQDARGCPTCQCRSPKLAVITNSRDEDIIVEEGYGVSSEVYTDGETTYSEMGVGTGVYVTADEDVADLETACNTSGVGVDGGVGGCRDGRDVHKTGSWWHRGPCVRCTCLTPGNTECNVTQCPHLTCPDHRQLKARGTCCPFCAESSRNQPISWRAHDSRSTSRVPLDRMPPTRPHDPDHAHDQAPVREETPRRSETVGDDGSTTKSAVQASPSDWRQVCMILVPLLVVFALVGSLMVHVWRRYHRDKYDINAYRPEETEKLRPVKTADDHHQVRHV